MNWPSFFCVLGTFALAAAMMARMIRDFFLAAAAVALPIIGLVELLIPR